MREIPELILISKPKGITSFDVIRRLRKSLGVRKMGHAGTLDPLAEGLMLIGVGPGTKRLAALSGLSKTYEADVLLGIRTSSGDLEGAVVEEADAEMPSEEKLRVALSSMVGTLDLPVPAFSAVKRGGVPLYKRARRGEAVDAPVRAMRIDSLQLLGGGVLEGRPFATVRMDVGSGVYVRSVAEELGRRLGVPATVARLVRTRIGEYRLEDAQPGLL